MRRPDGTSKGRDSELLGRLDPKDPYGHNNDTEKQQKHLEVETNVTVTEMKLRSSTQQLTLVFSTGEEYTMHAEFLRVESPSVEVQGHGSAHEKRLVFGKKFVRIADIEPVGNYAVRIEFDDGHNSGIYTWGYLHHLATHKYTLQKRYILALREHNRSRYPKHRGPKGSV